MKPGTVTVYHGEDESPRFLGASVLIEEGVLHIQQFNPNRTCSFPLHNVRYWTYEP